MVGCPGLLLEYCAFNKEHGEIGYIYAVRQHFDEASPCVTAFLFSQSNAVVYCE